MASRSNPRSCSGKQPRNLPGTRSASAAAGRPTRRRPGLSQAGRRSVSTSRQRTRTERQPRPAPTALTPQHHRSPQRFIRKGTTSTRGTPSILPGSTTAPQENTARAAPCCITTWSGLPGRRTASPDPRKAMPSRRIPSRPAEQWNGTSKGRTSPAPPARRKPRTSKPSRQRSSSRAARRTATATRGTRSRSPGIWKARSATIHRTTRASSGGSQMRQPGTRSRSPGTQRASPSRRTRSR